MKTQTPPRFPPMAGYPIGRWGTMLLLLWGVAPGAPSAPVDWETLAQAIDLPMQSLWPKLGLNLGFAFSPTHGFQLQVEKPDLSAAVASQRQQLARHPGDAAAYQRLGDLYAEA